MMTADELQRELQLIALEAQAEIPLAQTREAHIRATAHALRLERLLRTAF